MCDYNINFYIHATQKGTQTGKAIKCRIKSSKKWGWND